MFALPEVGKVPYYHRLQSLRTQVLDPGRIPIEGTIFAPRSATTHDHEARTFRDTDLIVGNGIPFGFPNREEGGPSEPMDVVVVVNASGVAGGGPLTQTLQGAECAKTIARTMRTNTETYYVGPDFDPGSFADHLTGDPPEKIADLISGATYPDHYLATKNALKEMADVLVRKGKKNWIVMSNGYTGFVPWALKEVMKEINAHDLGIKAICILFDSAFPDSSDPLYFVQNGVPVDRFYPPAYTPDENVETVLMLGNGGPVNIKHLRNRAPPGITSIATSLPHDVEYVNRWMRYQDVSIPQARENLTRLQEIDRRFLKVLSNPDTLYFPMIASAGYFDQKNTQKWMTHAQWMDIKKGTRTLVHTAQLVAEKTHRPVLLSGCDGFVQMALKIAQDEIINRPFTSIGSTDIGDVSPILYIAKHPIIKQGDYGNLLKSANVGIHRTSQANTYWEQVYAGSPTHIIGMPWHLYMDAEEWDTELYNRGLRVCKADSSPLTMADRLIQTSLQPLEAKSIIEEQLKIAMDVYSNPGQNFTSVLAYIAGVHV